MAGLDKSYTLTYVKRLDYHKNMNSLTFIKSLDDEPLIGRAFKQSEVHLSDDQSYCSENAVLAADYP